MGNVFEVWVLEELSQADPLRRRGADYKWVQRYGGDCKEKAFTKTEEFKNSGAECVKLKWSD